MLKQIYNTEEDFLDNCSCCYAILDFVENIKNTDTRWFFEKCYSRYDKDSDYEEHYVIFKSYITEEFKDYILSIKVIKLSESYSIHIVKKIDNLLSDIV